MKVLLLKDVSSIGKKGEIKDTSDGYALNYLIPRKLAVMADIKTMKKVSKEEGDRREAEEKKDKSVLELFDRLKGQKITISVKANEKGHLFAKVHSEEIINTIKNQLNENIDEDLVSIPQIKEIGEYTIKLSYKDESTEIKLFVENKN